jgi:uncharacterized protein (DUF1501 family)
MTNHQDDQPASGYDGFVYGRERLDSTHYNPPEPDYSGYEDSDDGSYGADDSWYGADDQDVPGVNPTIVTRRRFLTGLAISGAAGCGAFLALGRGGEVATLDPTTTTSPPTSPEATTPRLITPVSAAEPEVEGLLAPAPVDQRVLVLIELEGGNDGPSTVVPLASGAYYDLRPNMAIPAESVLPIDDEVGLNPKLAQLHARQLAVVEGVGPVDGSLSHFEMVARWEQGDLRGGSGLRTGYLARLADAVDDGSGATVGLSVSGFTPRFNNVTASTLSLTDLKALRVLTNDDWIFPAYRQAVTSFEGGPMTTVIDGSWDHLVAIGSSLPGEFGEIDQESPMVSEGRDLGRQLAMTAEMIRADVGVRVVHARLGGFDTHQGHQYKHENLMTQIDAAVGGFLQLLDDHGLANRVLVATSSEFGRRAGENGNGLDHGVASTMLLFGPVTPGRYGEPPSFTDLDGQGNLKTTVPFDSYLGTLAQEWLGVEAGSVLPTQPELLSIL